MNCKMMREALVSGSTSLDAFSKFTIGSWSVGLLVIGRNMCSISGTGCEKAHRSYTDATDTEGDELEMMLGG